MNDEISEIPSELPHQPVLLEEALDVLSVKPGGRYIDCTLGAGGHARGILERSSPDGRLLGLDADPRALDLARAQLSEFGSRVVLVNESFAKLAATARWNGFDPVDGILFDLGLSSMQLEYRDRGFSFRVEAPLDMRFDPREPITAADLVNTLSERELAEIFFQYGEEPRARSIARAIVRARARKPIETTTELAEVILRAAPQRLGRVHPATRVFQALRIVVNRELEVLDSALQQALELLAVGGVIAAISFHSLEDRLVKQFFAGEAKGCRCPPDLPVCVCGRQPRLQIVTKKAITPTEEEIQRNPRSRSAKLRAARRVIGAGSTVGKGSCVK